jgi:hypothetical protein
MAKMIATDDFSTHKDQFQVVDLRLRSVFDASPQMISGAALNIRKMLIVGRPGSIQANA